MADITMCTTQNCPQEATCYRKTAKASKYQSYAEFGEFSNAGCMCWNYLYADGEASKKKVKK